MRSFFILPILTVTTSIEPKKNEQGTGHKEPDFTKATTGSQGASKVQGASDKEHGHSHSHSHPQPQPEPKAEVQSQPKSKPQLQMEVHKHPHHVTHKKKWSEYLLEFFMIFFAVTLGFYAENIRERVADSDRVKEYMHSMIEDLKKDTANCRRVIDQNALIVHGLDTLITHISNPVRDQLNTDFIYAYCIKYRYENPEVHFSERTMSQLKNNGGLRLIKQSEISDALADYDEGVRFCDRQRDQALHYYQVLDETELSLFDFAAIKPLWDSLFNADVFNISTNTIAKTVSGKVNLKTNDEGKLKRYMNGIIYDQVAVTTYNNDLAEQSKKAASLIHLIQEKYGLNIE